MLAVAHDVRLNQRSNPKDPDSLTKRQVWENLSSHDPRAAEALTPLKYPDWIEYLRDLSARLYGRSGVTMEGFAGLSPLTITCEQFNSGIRLRHEEVEALYLLDAVRRDPDVLKEKDVKKPALNTFAQKWPKKKVPSGH